MSTPATPAKVTLTARLVESFAGVFLSPMYDEAVPTPAFHRECWELYCSDAQCAGVAAPRGHAKSTALTDDYILAVLLFRADSYVVLVSATEELAMEQLTGIATQLRENDDLREEFGISSFEVDSKSDIIVSCRDGHRFRVIAKGAGQRIRGRRWNGKRPGLIVCDDIEEDEQVLNRDTREKFRKWFFRALKPLLRKGGKVRMHGTILHEDALLMRLMKDKTWKTRLYRAHKGFDDFSELLWPEQWPESRLRAERDAYVAQNDAPGYSQEYLNNPSDNPEAYLQRPWFLPMDEADRGKRKILGAAADFAISKKDKANRTSLTVGGKCLDNLLHFVDQRVGRWDSLEIIEEMFAVQKDWNPEFFWVEDGQIWKALSPMLYKEMLRRNIWINCIPRTPISDKASRGRSLQRRMRAGGTRWDREAPWFPSMQEEMLLFTGHSEATLDDQFDSAALLSLGFDDASEVDEEDMRDEEDLEMEAQDPRRAAGRSAVTGY